LEPTKQCAWPDDFTNVAFPDHTRIYTTPVVADLNLDKDPLRIQPSIVVTTFKENETSRPRVGILRVFDGRDCREIMRVGTPDEETSEQSATRPAYGTQWAIGDLDNDVPQGGHPEIVGLQRPSIVSTNAARVVAYKIVDGTNGASPSLAVRWLGRRCGGTNPIVEVGTSKGITNLSLFGPGLWDLDDDGFPEVVLDRMVFDRNGCLLNTDPKDSDLYEHYLTWGQFVAVADVDLDNKPDLIRADGIYSWVADNAAPGGPRLGHWVKKTYASSSTALKPGHVAVANFGEFSTVPGQDTARLPEVVVVSAATVDSGEASTGSVRLQTLGGEILFQNDLLTIDQSYGGRGGAPTVADFDGDGQVEFATAANEFYTVFDPDCASGIDKTKRPGGKCDRPAWFIAYLASKGLSVTSSKVNGILWAQPSSDYSSSSTGSSIFDFNGDGKAEVVYRDECYLRVYDGASGSVVFSAPAASGTGAEYPVVADVDGDFSTEVVVPRAGTTSNQAPCPAKDPLFSGVSAPFERKDGFVILRDPQDRWVPSRPIWNQHAYSVTNVNDDGTVPKASAVKRNWEVQASANNQGLNNFRQNVQGSLASVGLADLTATVANLDALCTGQSGILPFQARVCNRGTNPVRDGVEIAFYAYPRRDGDGGVDGGAGGDGGVFRPDAPEAKRLCAQPTSKLLGIGDCTVVECSGDLPAGQDVYVVVDPSGTVADCNKENNQGASARVFCPVIR
jgi:hypothetical protein